MVPTLFKTARWIVTAGGEKNVKGREIMAAHGWWMVE
jgi:hypothetical protein